MKYLEAIGDGNSTPYNDNENGGQQNEEDAQEEYN